jgi:hypothetical protein
MARSMPTIPVVLTGLLGLVVVLSLVVHARLFIFRHDQKWRRERGAVFGDWPMSHGLDNLWRKADYAPEGHALIPVALGLQVLSVVLAIAAFSSWTTAS